MHLHRRRLRRTTTPSPWLALALGVACAPPRGEGDPARMAVIQPAIDARVVTIDSATSRITFTVARPAYVTFVEVLPNGRMMLVGSGASAPWARRFSAGTHTEQLWFPDSFGAPQKVMTPTEAQNADAMQRSYDACMVRASSARSTSRRTTNTPSSATDDAVARAQAACNAMYRPPTPSLVARPRPTSRHTALMVLLAASRATSTAELRARLAGLSVRVEDVGSLVEAIGAGLFVGTGARWSATHVPW